MKLGAIKGFNKDIGSKAKQCLVAGCLRMESGSAGVEDEAGCAAPVKGGGGADPRDGADGSAQVWEENECWTC